MPLSEHDLNQAIAEGIIDPERHGPLLLKLGKFTRIAGISEEDILLRLSEHTGEREQKWVIGNRRAIKGGALGLVYTGGFVGVPLRMRAIVAVFMRNYVDARIMSCEQAVNAEKPPTLLVLNDFGSDPTEWVKKSITKMLMQRATAGKPTLLHVPDLDVISGWYGESAKDLILHSFVKVVVNV